MALDVINIINQKKLEAENIINQGNFEAQQLISETKKKCSALIDEKTECAKNDAICVINTAKTAAEKEIRVLENDFSSRKETLLLIIKRNFDKTVESLVSSLTEGEI